MNFYLAIKCLRAQSIDQWRCRLGRRLGAGLPHHNDYPRYRHESVADVLRINRGQLLVTLLDGAQALMMVGR